MLGRSRVAHATYVPYLALALLQIFYEGIVGLFKNPYTSFSQTHKLLIWKANKVDTSISKASNRD